LISSSSILLRRCCVALCVLRNDCARLRDPTTGVLTSGESVEVDIVDGEGEGECLMASGDSVLRVSGLRAGCACVAVVAAMVPARRDYVSLPTLSVVVVVVLSNTVAVLWQVGDVMRRGGGCAAEDTVLRRKLGQKTEKKHERTVVVGRSNRSTRSNSRRDELNRGRAHEAPGHAARHCEEMPS
jgi:hypothetical protein